MFVIFLTKSYFKSLLATNFFLIYLLIYYFFFQILNKFLIPKFYVHLLYSIKLVVNGL